jgi:arylsulfatase A-like enzyme
MLRAGEWKFIFAQTPESTAVNALYNLREDPLELTNLLGPSARTPETVERAEAMKQLLLTWLEQNRSPHLDGVRARAV